MARHRIALLEDDAALRDVLVDVIGELDPDLDPVPVPTHDELMRLVSAGGVDGVIADAWGPSHADLADDERDAILALARHVPLILLTGRIWSSQVEAPELSLVALLRKPFELETLGGAVAQLLLRIDGADRPIAAPCPS